MTALRAVKPSTLTAGSSDIDADLRHWDSLVRFFERTYFTRTWIVQEISLRQMVGAICGSHSVKWNDVEVVSEILTVTIWSRWMSERALAEHSEPNSQGTTLCPTC